MVMKWCEVTRKGWKGSLESDTNTKTGWIALKNLDLEIGLVLFYGKDIAATLKK